VSVIALLVLFVGAGIGYVWYQGMHSVVNTTAEVQAKPITPHEIKPTQPKPDAVVGVSVQYITSPIPQGSNAMVTIKTNAGAKCTIAAVYNNVPSKDSGLMPKVADEFGMASWTWTIEPTVPVGTWPVNVTCANIKNSAVVRGDLKVEKATPGQ